MSGRGLCDELITRPEESYRLLCVVVCDQENSRMGHSAKEEGGEYMATTIKNEYKPKQHELVGTYSGEAVLLLYGRKWIHKYIRDQFCLHKTLRHRMFHA